MKILAISDTHGHISNIKAVMDIAKKSDIKAVVHCGDWDNVESIEAVLKFEIPLYAVMGNADVDSDIEEYLKFNSKKFDPYFLKFEIGGRRIGVTHNVKSDFVKSASNIDIVFSGHYHSKEEKMVNFVKFIRPGALLNGINFAIYETETNEVEFVSE
jgi:putative phosphoesterase